MHAQDINLPPVEGAKRNGAVALDPADEKKFEKLFSA
jgi:hypothetical protein